MSFTFFQSSNLFRRNFTQVTQLSTISLTHVCHKFYRFRFICKNCVNYTAVEGGVAPELHQLHLHVTPTWVHLHHSFWHNSRTWRTHTTWRPRPHLHSIARQKNEMHKTYGRINVLKPRISFENFSDGWLLENDPCTPFITSGVHQL